MRHVLKLHPDSRCGAAIEVAVELARPNTSGLVLTYSVTGAIGELRMPPITAATRTDELWRHTCFEAFVRPSPGEAYDEFNFAPSTQWAAYRFDRYRGGMRPLTEIGAPHIKVQAAPDRFALQAALDLSGLPRDGRWRLGLAAVIEDIGGGRSYWALAHPPGKPDFHHADGFTIELA